VILETIIDRQGCVRSPKILRGTRSEASAAALEALRHYVFHPATLDGKPISVHFVLTFNFD
jgi:outer membrane biosynthesis protein TonB